MSIIYITSTLVVLATWVYMLKRDTLKILLIDIIWCLVEIIFWRWSQERAHLWTAAIFGGGAILGVLVFLAWGFLRELFKKR
jgi:hypothetical protein